MSFVQDMERIGSQGLLLVLASASVCAIHWPTPALARAEGAGSAAGKAETAPATEGSGLPQVAPVISDEEFEAAIPALPMEQDPEQALPLESMEEFERRTRNIEAEDARELGEPGDSSRLDDAELFRPLPSTDEFVNAAPPPVEVQPADNSGIAYRTELLGLDEADAQTPAALRGLFDELSALRSGKGKAANLAMVTARLREDAELVRTILASHGWFSPAISTRIDRVAPDGGGSLSAVIEVVAGTRYRLAQVAIDAQPTEPPELIVQNLALRTGQPVVADEILAAEAKVSVILPRNGYPFANVGQRDVALDAETGEAFYTLPVETGPRSRYGDITTGGDSVFDARHAGVISRFRPGEPYDSREVDDLRKALAATGLFAAVSVEPQRTGRQVGDGTEYVDIHVEQQAGRPRTIAGSAGYATGEGLSLEASWTHRNLFPPEGALVVNAAAGTTEQGLGVTFRRSNAGKRDRTFGLTAEALHSDFSAYSAYTGRIAARISRDSTPIWQKRFTHSLGLELLASGERDFDFALGMRNRRTYYIAGLSGEAGFDTTRDLLDPVSGFRLTALVQPEGSLNSGFHPYVRARIEGSAYFPMSKGLVVAGRIRLGSIQGSNRADIAPSRRFYSGGGGSVRGFAYQKLGPLDPNGDPVGGRSLNEASAEIRFRTGDYGIVAFFDTGQSYAGTLPRFSGLRFGAGAGFRYYTNFGPVRVDLATPIDRRPGENRFNIYISIGQAF